MTQAAVLEPSHSKSGPEDKAGGCDITKPVASDRRIDVSLEAMRREWHAVARYKLTLSKEGDWNDQSVVAEWLPYDEVILLRDKLDAELLAKQGGIPRFARAAYGIDLHTPAVTKGNRASVGDLLLHERVVPHGDFSLSDSYVIRQFFLAAEVTEVSADSRILGYRDREGEHVQTPPKKPHVISASLIDVQGVLAHIANAEKARGHWASEFGSPKDMQSILVRYPLVATKAKPAAGVITG